MDFQGSDDDDDDDDEVLGLSDSPIPAKKVKLRKGSHAP